MIRMIAAASLAAGAFLAPASLKSQDAEVALSPQQQFELFRSWKGRWQVAETTALQIVFEETARGTTVVERWEVGDGLHSMTVYHMDGDALVATHYCPQGNQPRLQTTSISSGAVRFEFRDVTDLNEGESHTHALWFTPGADGSLVRSEVYTGDDGLQEPSSYTLSRANTSG